MKKGVFLLLLFINSVFAQTTLPLIPQPKELQLGEGNFLLNSKTIFLVKDADNNEAALFNSFLQTKYEYVLEARTNSKSSDNTIAIIVDDAKNTTSEKYELLVTPKQITIKAVGNRGVFYAFQTLIQLLPANKYLDAQIPCLTIKDEPKFKWRGMHLDVSRHFFPVAFVKKYIDYIAMYKMNTFHWHLTDDQGWRIEILKYPLLTQVGSIRSKSMIGHFTEKRFDSEIHQGFYTQEEIKDVVAYAKQRHIAIIPEIEMPGHSLAALAAYPQYSCTGGPFQVATQWGSFDDVFCPKEETFQFIEEILDEVMELFPSEYIHIGGDECSKVRWKTCPSCQQLMNREGLADADQLQSYFIRRIEQFLNAYNKKLIGWDEILEGGLAPNATVMSWRGIKGGIAAVKEKHDVIMCPSSHCYFDHYQGDPKNEPVAIGGFTPIEKVYSFNPIPNELTPEESKYIIGAQGNVWTEYINTPQDVEYMALPRMAALAEVVWGTSDAKEYNNFQNRLVKHFDVLDRMYVNYSKSIFQIATNIGPSATGKGIEVGLKSVYGNQGIRYTTNGDVPTMNSKTYESPITVTENTTVKAAYFDKNDQKSVAMEQSFYISKSAGKSITIVTEPNPSYATGGKFALIDGVRGDSKRHSRDWLGFLGNGLNATIDLGTPTAVSKVTVDVLSNEGSWIHYPKSVEVSVSNDGVQFKSVKVVTVDEIKTQKGIVTMDFPIQNAKYIRVIAQKLDKIPAGFPGAGAGAWLFVDEIMVE